MTDLEIYTMPGPGEGLKLVVLCISLESFAKSHVDVHLSVNRDL